MWECGMAAHPQSPNTSIVVFQCGRDVPSPFHDVLRVNARKPEDIKRFMDQLLRDPAVFAGGAIAPDLKDVHVEGFARELHTRLAQVLPPLEDGQVEQWPAWPYLRLELPRIAADRIEPASEPERLEQSHRHTPRTCAGFVNERSSYCGFTSAVIGAIIEHTRSHPPRFAGAQETLLAALGCRDCEDDTERPTRR
jgi:hypothetical protein